jgi:hypothetical protein
MHKEEKTQTQNEGIGIFIRCAMCTSSEISGISLAKHKKSGIIY